MKPAQQQGIERFLIATLMDGGKERYETNRLVTLNHSEQPAKEKAKKKETKETESVFQPACVETG